MSNQPLFVPPGHFYSPISDPLDAADALRAIGNPASIAGIDLNEEKQIDLLRSIAPAMTDCGFPEIKDHAYRYYFKNDQYSYGDAIVYQALLRYFSPHRLIEVGSGYSSAVALDTRDRHKAPRQITFIEPYPSRLLSLLRATDAGTYDLLERKVQAVDLGLFDTLKSGDFLFVDSSHVAKTGSDLNVLLFDVMGRLQSGVIVHFHDIFWPFEYPARWAVQELRSWNEVYIMRAFLSYSSRFEIIFFNDYLARRHPERCHQAAPLFMRNPGGSLWLRVRH